MRYLWILFGLLMASCGRPLEDSVPANVENISGKWRLHEIIPADHRRQIFKADPCELKAIWHFEDSGVLSVSVDETECRRFSYTTEWSVANDSIDIKMLNVAGKAHADKHEIVQLTATTLIVKISGSGDFVTLKKQ
jgi:hypothetical protein